MHIVFIADDDVDDKDIFQMALKSVIADAVIIEVNNGEELMTKLDSETPPLPDIIFLDISMPVMNGFESIEALKANPLLKNVPVVILTTSKHEADRELMWSKGAHFYITKPNNFHSFITILKIIFNNPAALKMRTKEGFVLNQFI